MINTLGLQAPGGAFSMWILSSLIWSAMSLFLVMCRGETKGAANEIERLAENKLREIQGKTSRCNSA